MLSRILTILFLCCCISYADAQRYPFYNLGVENGLIQSQVTSMVQDRCGHLWIGTIGGLSRYDGSQFTNYSVRDGLPSNNIQALATDGQGNLWIGSPNGVSKFDGKKFEHYIFKAPENTVDNSVTNIKVTEGNTIYCVAGNKVYRIHNGTTNAITLPDTSDAISAIQAFGDTLLLGTTNGKVLTYSNGNWDSLFVPTEGFDRDIVVITNIFRDNRNRTWLTTSHGLYNIEGDTIQVFKFKHNPLYNVGIASVAEDTDSAIWFGGIGGCIRLKDSSIKLYNKQNGFTENAVNTIITDKEGNIWFGTNGQGAFRYSGGNFSILDENNGLKNEQVTSITGDRSGKIYLSTFNAGLYSYSQGKVEKIELPNNNAVINAMNADRQGNIWLGTRGYGLLKKRGNSYKTYQRPLIPSNVVTYLYRDTLNRLWIGTVTGTAIMEGDSIRILDAGNAAVMSYTTIGKDSILIASEKGLQLYNNGNVVPFKTNAAPDSSNIICLTTSGSRIWFGTSDNGAIAYDLSTKRTLVLNKNSGLKSDFIYSIVTDDSGNVWVGTGYGIHMIEMAGGKPLITFYGKEQGITGMESNQNAVYKDHDGTLWFGTTKGLLHFTPGKRFVEPKPVSIVLQSVKLFGDHIRDTTYYDSTDNWYNVPFKLHLPYKKNNITFSFKGISLTGNEQLQYRYRIDGLESPWSDWTPLNSVTYSALPPGKYTLRVECRTGSNDNIKALAYPFEIITPIHKTRWFSLAILGACILLGVSIQYMLNKRKQNRLALLERLRREEQGKVRQRTAEDFHDEVGNKLTRINVLTNVLKTKLGEGTPDTRRIIQQIQSNTSELYGGTRDILWSLQPANDNLYEILHRIRDFGNDLFQDTPMKFVFSGDEQQWRKYRLPLDMSRNLIMIFKEALNNCLKYAEATTVSFEATIKEGDILQIILTDNGKGFNIEEVERGNGLNNMRNRAARLNGKLYVDSKPGRGTSINLHFRLQEKLKQK